MYTRNFNKTNQNFDIFCKILAQKIVQPNEEENCNKLFDPIEKLLYKKCVLTKSTKIMDQPTFLDLESNKPLIDILENEREIKVLVWHPIKNREYVIKTGKNKLEICADRCKKIKFPCMNLRIEGMISRICSNGVLEITIPKT
ncbi:hypothetical protein KEJ33_02880 [Candidatus Bathyarchaeota archaeon]|nr:hypothetical protein [Candidatus Bathyarchaeota archaeon]